MNPTQLSNITIALVWTVIEVTAAILYFRAWRDARKDEEAQRTAERDGIRFDLAQGDVDTYFYFTLRAIMFAVAGTLAIGAAILRPMDVPYTTGRVFTITVMIGLEAWGISIALRIWRRRKRVVEELMRRERKAQVSAKKLGEPPP